MGREDDGTGGRFPGADQIDGAGTQGVGIENNGAIHVRNDLLREKLCIPVEAHAGTDEQSIRPVDALHQEGKCLGAECAGACLGPGYPHGFRHLCCEGRGNRYGRKSSDQTDSGTQGGLDGHEEGTGHKRGSTDDVEVTKAALIDIGGTEGTQGVEQVREEDGIDCIGQCGDFFGEEAEVEVADAALCSAPLKER